VTRVLLDGTPLGLGGSAVVADDLDVVPVGVEDDGAEVARRPQDTSRA
jgi:hypothetical protein